MIFFKIFKKYPNLIHGILEKKDGSVNLFSRTASKKNVLKALSKLGYKAKIQDLIFAEQIHGKNIHFCPPDVGGYLKFGVDGLITETPGQILIVRTADCIPLLIYDPAQKRIRAIHVGRRGLFKGIVENALKNIGGKTEDLRVGIGPHIRKCCYSFEKNYFKKSRWKEYLKDKRQKLYLDLTQILFDKLIGAGLKKRNIEDCRICTFCQENNFYSARRAKAKPNFYRDEKFLCFGAFIGLKK